MNQNEIDNDVQQSPGNRQNSGSSKLKTAGAPQDKEAQRRSGQHSHGSGQTNNESPSGSSNRSSSHSGTNASGAAIDKDAQRRGGQNSHGGNR